jgi:hypothetical protein
MKKTLKSVDSTTQQRFIGQDHAHQQGAVDGGSVAHMRHALTAVSHSIQESAYQLPVTAHWSYYGKAGDIGH